MACGKTILRIWTGILPTPVTLCDFLSLTPPTLTTRLAIPLFNEAKKAQKSKRLTDSGIAELAVAQRPLEFVAQAMLVDIRLACNNSKGEGYRR